jgi:hypothetical protein
MKKVKGLEKYLGLMFLPRKKAGAIEIEFKKEVSVPIHSWFVFFDFMAYWYDAKGNMIQSRLIKPFQKNITCPQKFKRIIEVPRIEREEKNKGIKDIIQEQED